MFELQTPPPKGYSPFNKGEMANVLPLPNGTSRSAGERCLRRRVLRPPFTKGGIKGGLSAFQFQKLKIVVMFSKPLVPSGHFPLNKGETANILPLPKGGAPMNIGEGLSTIIHDKNLQ